MKHWEMVILSISTTLLFLSCQSSERKELNSNTMDKFTWNIQLAGYDFQKYDEKGETSYDRFIKEFDNFPWIEQLEKRNAMTDGCSATLSVKDLKTGLDLWVSIAGDKDDYDFLIGYIHPKEVKTFFGLGKPKAIRWCEIFRARDVGDIKSSFKYFFNREHHLLENTISRLERFDELESLN